MVESSESIVNLQIRLTFVLSRSIHQVRHESISFGGILSGSRKSSMNVSNEGSIDNEVVFLYQG